MSKLTRQQIKMFDLLQDNKQLWDDFLFSRIPPDHIVIKEAQKRKVSTTYFMCFLFFLYLCERQGNTQFAQYIHKKFSLIFFTFFQEVKPDENKLNINKVAYKQPIPFQLINMLGEWLEKTFIEYNGDTNKFNKLLASYYQRYEKTQNR
tara:strand:- start:2946 stop:3392 length:447 start_codon:yes stop_codon:yes gene_type:complete